MKTPRRINRKYEGRKYRVRIPITTKCEDTVSYLIEIFQSGENEFFSDELQFAVVVTKRNRMYSN